jgi:ABC-type hemin transport system ATPase subunit
MSPNTIAPKMPGVRLTALADLSLQETVGLGGPHLPFVDGLTGNLDSARTPRYLGLLRGICHEDCVLGVLVTYDLDAIPFVDGVVNLRDGALTEGSRTTSTRAMATRWRCPIDVGRVDHGVRLAQATRLPSRALPALCSHGGAA